MDDTRTEAQRKQDMWVSNVIDFDHFTGPLASDAVRSGDMYHPDGFIRTAEGKEVRRWFINMNIVRGDLYGFRRRERGADEWVWPPHVLDARDLHRRMGIVDRKVKEDEDTLWTWIRKLHGSKTAPACVPDYDSELSQYKLEVLHIDLCPYYRTFPDGGWARPDEPGPSQTKEPNMSYGFSMVDARKLGDDVVVDFEAGKLFKRMEHRVRKLMMESSRHHGLFMLALERIVLKDLESRWGRRFMVWRGGKGICAHIEPHETVEVVVDGETFKHHVWYHTEAGYVYIAHVEGPGVRTYRIEV